MNMGEQNKRVGFAAVIAWLDSNKPFLAKLTYVSLFLTYLIGIPAWPAISERFGLDSSLGTSLVIGAFIAHLGVLLSLMVDMHNEMTPRETWFQSHQEALPSIRAALNAAVRERPCRIVWIGVSMQSAWLALENVFRAIEESTVAEIKVTLLLVNPEFFRTLPGSNEGLATLTEGQMEYMSKRCEAMQQALLATQSEIVLAQYSYMPNFHGLLVGDHTLFLSTVRWHGKNRHELSVPREPKELLTSNTNRGRYAIELYHSWLEKGCVTAQEQGRLFRYPSLPTQASSPAPPATASSAENTAALSGHFHSQLPTQL
jgi:hypothetical protein